MVVPGSTRTPTGSNQTLVPSWSLRIAISTASADGASARHKGGSARPARSPPPAWTNLRRVVMVWSTSKPPLSRATRTTRRCGSAARLHPGGRRCTRRPHGLPAHLPGLEPRERLLGVHVLERDHVDRAHQVAVAVLPRGTPPRPRPPGPRP